MKYKGREIDVLALWANYVDFPPNVKAEGFLPLVRCPNPNHDTMKKHFQINADEPLVHCFTSCGISGTYENAIQLIEGCSRAEARKKILRYSRRGGDSSRRESKRVSGSNRDRISTAIVPDISLYTYVPQAGIDYLASRGISAESISQWELGWNPDTGRITIPARDLEGRLKFVIERGVKNSQRPRYLYTEGAVKSDLLFGACKLDRRVVRSWGIVLVEGSLDVIRLHQHGISLAVGILGSRVSDRQAEIISRLRPARIFTMFDKDSTGVGATFAVRYKLRRIPISVCRYPSGVTDPAELTREEANRAIERAISYPEFVRRTRSLIDPKGIQWQLS